MLIDTNIKDKRSLTRFNTLEQDFNNKYGFFDYSRSIYTGMRKNIIIKCLKHNHEFKYTPMKHLVGTGCKYCKTELSSKTKLKKNSVLFKEKALKVHGNKYDYSEVIYENAKEKITIICKKHGSFEQTPNNHLNGKGCKYCYYETVVGSTEETYKGRETILYLIKIKNHYKVGITLSSIKNRYSREYSENMKIEILEEIKFSDGLIAHRIEKYIKDNIVHINQNEQNLFSGYTETTKDYNNINELFKQSLSKLWL